MDAILNFIYYYLPYDKESTGKSLEIFEQIPQDILFVIIENFSYHQLNSTLRISKHFPLSVIADKILKIPGIMFNSFKNPFFKRTDQKFYSYHYSWYALKFVNNSVEMIYLNEKYESMSGVTTLPLKRNKIPDVIIKDSWSETYHGRGYYPSGIKYCIVNKILESNKIIIDKFVDFINKIVLPRQYELIQGYFPTRKYRKFIKYPLIITDTTQHFIKIGTDMKNI